jgi:hypothetical protein
LKSFEAPEVAVTVTVFIRYQLDPFKRAMFEQYAKNWLGTIPSSRDAAATCSATGCRMKAPTTSRLR